ncbi:uncharacterized protein LOC118560057 [Fundulus heteroclitus]|uniref:uncharacterized protein LOC118560057 n=1 Tax=Fundulus heteroclitus TaxID=8078 RepID=UPI00165B3C45|nr:uncharacterized protein LOC118560057 [Fundulus heteroclitus]
MTRVIDETRVRPSLPQPLRSDASGSRRVTPGSGKMAPRKNASEDMEKLRRAIEFLTEEVSSVKTQQKGIFSLVEEIKALRIQNAEKDKKIERLQSRVAELEQHARLNEDFGMEGYEFVHLNRNNKTGGGVGFFVKNELNAKIVDKMTVCVDDLLECVTIEIGLEKMKNAVISCVYRAPGGNVELFTEWFGHFFNKTQMLLFICGDFNINLMNTGHRKTEQFINTVYSMGLYPTITRPTRLTCHSAKLIDNIFTNYMENSIESGILITDISDHLPIFTLFNCNYRRKKLAINGFRYKRIKTEGAMMALKQDLLHQNWELVYIEENVNAAYEKFMDMFNMAYNKHCPVKKFKESIKQINSPWVTEGLRRACMKKNSLYRHFLKKRTVEAEVKYKWYKNKLTNILRSCKREYYNKLLEGNKNNIKGIWTILNSIVRKESKGIKLPEYFTEKDKIIKDMTDVANGFNRFFVNVGPELASKISETNTSVCEDMGERNPYTMFLGSRTPPPFPVPSPTPGSRTPPPFPVPSPTLGIRN